MHNVKMLRKHVYIEANYQTILADELGVSAIPLFWILDSEFCRIQLKVDTKFSNNS